VGRNPLTTSPAGTNGQLDGALAFRLATIQNRAVLVQNAGVYDLEKHSTGRFSADPMQALERFRELHEIAEALPDVPDGAVSVAELGICVPRSQKIFAVGLNYRAHARETERQPPATPLVFAKFRNCLAGPSDDIILRGATTDWEAELVVVMGTRARDISRAKAWDHVAGLTCGQDLSDRETQFANDPPHFDLGKSFDGYGPIGPYVVSADQLEERAADLEITCKVNGELRQHARTSDMIFTVADLVAHISSVCTFEPGDLIFTGTPSGVGRTTGTYLQPGDTVTTTIEGIGTLTNRCVAERA